MTTGRVLVVGASLAGFASARALRTLGYDGEVTVVGAETHRPYDRPPLSKAFLAGSLGADELALDADDLDVDWVLGRRAVQLDAMPGDHRVRLDDGALLRADAVVIATGSVARALPGTRSIAGVHTLRTLDDALALRADLVPGARLVLVGAGFIGAEIAATASKLGLDVTLIEAAPSPLAGPLGSTMGALVGGLHARHGVGLICGTGVAGLVGTRRVQGIALADGRTVPADVVVIGVGAVPATGWLDSSGLALAPDGGVLCDRTGATSAPGVYAVGDCASWFDPVLGRQHRIEHWTDAHDRPVRTARALLGDAPDDAAPAPYFWSDQYDVRIQFAGRRHGDEVVTIEAGSPDTDDVLAVYRRGDVATAVLGLNQPRLFGRLRRTLGTERTAA